MSGEPDRRSPPPRMPFVRRCRLGFSDGHIVTAFIVNISSIGAYITRDDFAPRASGSVAEEARASPSSAAARELPWLGEPVTCRFTLPESEAEVAVAGTVSWLNSRQQHPVHSLPPGFGLRFDTIRPDDRARIEALVGDYLARGRQ